ncbi:hypothetical protein PRIPAC_85460 [Pristionchus pacificus]|uniref:Uncharacterized protein n=1 Tax=Pristionchus pacificus TaxID=54126 RepID=A0A2A6BUT4_PRIPA|nr:hypothetical protein PRIPAC_85460 [Pristionchus pacificus]|eukprot:PDM69684.1 hypothetical protein PRIPAC_44780 [Pristionchus pacificus]
MSRGLRLFITLKLESTWREESEHPALLREKNAASSLYSDLFKNYDAQLSTYNSRTDVNGSAILIGLMRARLTGVNDRQMEFRSIVGHGLYFEQGHDRSENKEVTIFRAGSLVLIGVFYGATAENLINNAVR